MSKNKGYDKALKLQAARLVADHGYTFQEAGERLGVSSWSVRSWLNQLCEKGELPAKESPVSTVDKLTTQEQAHATL